jgi:hypothetical protein
MQRNLGTRRGKAGVGFEHFARIRILERNHITVETDFLHQVAVEERGLDQRFHLIAGVSFEKLRRDRAAIDADADGTIGIARNASQPADFLSDGLVALDVMQMARVVANLVDVRADPCREAVVFLQVDRERCCGLAPDLAQRVNFLVVVDRDTHHPRAGATQLLALRHRRVDIAGFRGAHALHHHRRSTADMCAADANRSRSSRRGLCFHRGRP